MTVDLMVAKKGSHWAESLVAWMAKQWAGTWAAQRVVDLVMTMADRMVAQRGHRLAGHLVARLVEWWAGMLAVLRVVD